LPIKYFLKDINTNNQLALKVGMPRKSRDKKKGHFSRGMGDSLSPLAASPAAKSKSESPIGARNRLVDPARILERLLLNNAFSGLHGLYNGLP